MRHKAGDSAIYHEFEVFEDRGNESKFLLAAKKIRAKPSKYIISTEKLNSSTFEHNIAMKLRYIIMIYWFINMRIFSSNYLGTRFKIYEGPSSRSRLQIASILYVNIFKINIYLFFRGQMFLAWWGQEKWKYSCLPFILMVKPLTDANISR